MPQEELIELIDDREVTILGDQRNLSIANFITHEACQKYYENLKKVWVPISFIEFYFEEYRSYESMSKTYLKEFFSIYNADDLPSIVESYTTTYYTIIKKKTNKKDELCYKLDVKDYVYTRLSDPDALGRFDPELYKNLDNIANHMEKRDELLSLREIYENYMMRKIVLSRKPNVQAVTGNKKNTSVTPAITKATNVDKNDTLLVGSQTDIPDQKGKVVKLYIPKLSLPSPYPTLQEKSRINSEHRVRKLTSADKQIKIINKYKFNSIKYKRGFIEKRKAAAKPKRKFNFDF